MSEPYRYCVVPQCTNTKRTTPDKIFVHVPRDRKIRKRWFVAMRRDKFMSDLSTAYVCEDHFNVSSLLDFKMSIIRSKLMLTENIREAWMISFNSFALLKIPSDILKNMT
uniref:THAP-type domain-containing protein n=1 Tax=Cacopsylla melanoneura TaxID=428564 RepID=A0A8D8WKF5_9HEMI